MVSEHDIHTKLWCNSQEKNKDRQHEETNRKKIEFQKAVFFCQKKTRRQDLMNIQKRNASTTKGKDNRTWNARRNVQICSKGIIIINRQPTLIKSNKNLIK